MTRLRVPQSVGTVNDQNALKGQLQHSLGQNKCEWNEHLYRPGYPNKHPPGVAPELLPVQLLKLLRHRTGSRHCCRSGTENVYKDVQVEDRS